MAELGKRLSPEARAERERRLRLLEEEMRPEVTMSGAAPSTPSVEGEFIKNFVEIHAGTNQDGLPSEKESLLGWTNRTADLNKINDVELFSATTGDYEFIQRHQAVRALLDANKSVGGKLSIVQVYDMLRAGYDGSDDASGIEVDVRIDDDGLVTTNNNDGYHIRVDLYDLVHLKRVLDFFETIHPEDRAASGLTPKKIEQLFWDDQPIPLTVQLRDSNGNPVQDANGHGSYSIANLAEYRLIPRMQVPIEEFEAYEKKIDKCQTQFQMLSSWRDESIQNHHAENGGHAQMFEDPLYGERYLPASAKMAAAYVRADVLKTSARFRAEGHPHEIGFYDEGTGICVGFEAEALSIFRGEIAYYREFEATRKRTFNNLLGLNSSEQLMANEEEMIFYFTKREENGRTDKGLIYDAIRNHHDTAMKFNRGYGITEQEIEDRHITDVAGKRFAENPNDFLMAFAKQDKVPYTTQDVFRKLNRDDKVGKPRLVFYGLMPEAVATSNGDVEKHTQFPSGDQATAVPTAHGKLTFHGVTAFARYINWRIERGDIPEISSKIDEDFLANIEAKDIEKISPTVDSVLGFAFHKDKVQEVKELILGNIPGPIDVIVDGQTITIQDYDDLMRRFIDILQKDGDLQQDLKKVTGEKDLQAALQRLIELIRTPLVPPGQGGGVQPGGGQQPQQPPQQPQQPPQQPQQPPQQPQQPPQQPQQPPQQPQQPPQQPQQPPQQPQQPPQQPPSQSKSKVGMSMAEQMEQLQQDVQEKSIKQEAKQLGGFFKELFGAEAKDAYHFMVGDAAAPTTVSGVTGSHAFDITTPQEAATYILDRLGATYDANGNYEQFPEVPIDDPSLSGYSLAERKRRGVTPEQKQLRDVLEQATGERDPVAGLRALARRMRSIEEGQAGESITPDMVDDALT